MRLVAARSGDALAASAILARALEREGVGFQLTLADSLTPELADRIAAGKHAVAVAIGLGDASADRLAPLAAGVVLVDGAHGPEDPVIAARLTAHAGRYDASSEASLSFLALLLARSLAARHLDLAPLAVAGALADRQRPLRGLNGELASEAVETGALRATREMALDGGTMLDALAGSLDPFLPGLTGRARAAKKLLDEAGIAPDASPRALDVAAQERLVSLLALRRLEAGLAPDDLVATRHRGADGVAPDAAAWGLEAAALAGRPALAFGDAAGLLAAGAALRERVLAQALRVERDGLLLEGAVATLAVAEGDLATSLAGVAASHLAPPGARAALVRVRADGGAAFVGRATARAAPDDDLGAAFAAAAKALGGAGGGRRGAAHAFVPEDAAHAFAGEVAKRLGGASA